MSSLWFREEHRAPGFWASCNELLGGNTSSPMTKTCLTRGFLTVLVCELYYIIIICPDGGRIPYPNTKLAKMISPTAGVARTGNCPHASPEPCSEPAPAPREPCAETYHGAYGVWVNFKESQAIKLLTRHDMTAISLLAD